MKKQVNGQYLTSIPKITSKHKMRAKTNQLFIDEIMNRLYEIQGRGMDRGWDVYYTDFLTKKLNLIDEILPN